MHRRLNALALGALILGLLVLGSYLPALKAGFIWDDDAYVEENRALRDVAGLGRIWVEPRATPQYYPMVHTTFWIEEKLWGTEPFGFHLVNVLLHAANAILLWILLRRLEVPGAWLAAALFGLHPVHVESVAWVTERKNVLSGLFYLLSLIALLPLIRMGSPAEARRPGRTRWIVAGLLFVASLLSKTVTASMPAAALLLIWWKRGRIAAGEVGRLVPFFTLGAGLGLFTVWLETHHVGASGEIWEITKLQRILVAGRAVWFYFGKLVWPFDLSFNYARWELDPIRAAHLAYPIAAVAAAALLWTLRRRIGRGPFVASLFYVGTLFPALGFFNVYPFRYSYVADHFQYLASIGPLVLLGAGLARAVAATAARRRFARAAPALILLGLGALTWTQTRIYADLETLWSDTLRKNPESWLANNNYGNILMKRREFSRAADHFRIALASSPTYGETYNNIAIAYMNLGLYQEAIAHAKRAVAMHPELKTAYNTVGNSLIRSGRPEEALPWLEHAVHLDPEWVSARNNYAVALTQTRRYEEAVSHLIFVLERDPENVLAHANLGIALVELDRIPEAIDHFAEAQRLDPGNPIHLGNLESARRRLEGME